jgi:hypothetical protein
MKKETTIELSGQEMMDLLKDKWKADVSKMLCDIIIHARMMNFSVGEKYKLGIMHGTEYLHGLLERKIITNELYQKLKEVAEDESITFEIVI